MTSMLYSARMHTKPNLPEDIGGSAFRSWRDATKAAICMTYILFGIGYTHIFNRRYQ